MDTGMHPRMRTVRLLGRALGAAALALALAACGGHRAPASSAVMLPALQPPAPPEPGPTYRIQQGDELHVRFTYQPEMNEQVPVRVRLHPNDVLYVPRTWIADMDIVVDQYIRGLIPTLPRVGAGVQVN